MITNNEEIEKYEKPNKIYIPNDYINNSYKYFFNGDNYIRIITNNNCNQQYNTIYCSCYDYNYKENIMTKVYQCNANQTNYEIAKEMITNDINYSINIRLKYIIDKTLPIAIMLLVVIIIFNIVGRSMKA